MLQSARPVNNAGGKGGHTQKIATELVAYKAGVEGRGEKGRARAERGSRRHQQKASKHTKKAGMMKVSMLGNLQDVCIVGLQLLPPRKELASLLQMTFFQLQPGQRVQVGHMPRVGLDACQQMLPGQNRVACLPL